MLIYSEQRGSYLLVSVILLTWKGRDPEQRYVFYWRDILTIKSGSEVAVGALHIIGIKITHFPSIFTETFL